MKANAPEEIYLLPDDRNLNGLSICWYNAPYRTGAIEYIRADAFIEKACSWLEENKDKYLYNTGEKGEYIPTCSDKMIEEFRKYMKGE